MLPNYASAVTLNNLVKAYNITYSTLDISSSIQEYGLAINNTDIKAKLGYGLSFVNTNNSSLVKDIFTVGKGLALSDLSNEAIELPAGTQNQFGFTSSDILSTLTEISNCYVLGAAYLTVTESTANIEFSLAKSSSAPNGEPFIFSKDVSVPDILNILEYTTEIIYPKPTLDTDYSVLLYKFILDVDKYNNEYKKDRVFIIISDNRKPRGYFGFSEENLFFRTIPKIIQANSDIANIQSSELENIKIIVEKWIALDGWNPSFTQYWGAANPTLPVELANFIETELGINLGYEITARGISSIQKISRNTLG